MDYEKMSNKELETELKNTENSFNEYAKILQEVYNNMSELHDTYKEIEKILNNRNDR